MSMSSAAARLAGVPFAALLGGRPRRFGIGSSAVPLASDLVLLLSRPDTLLADDFVNGLETTLFGVSSFLRFEERAESSIVLWELR